MFKNVGRCRYGENGEKCVSTVETVLAHLPDMIVVRSRYGHGSITKTEDPLHLKMTDFGVEKITKA